MARAAGRGERDPCRGPTGRHGPVRPARTHRQRPRERNVCRPVTNAPRAPGYVRYVWGCRRCASVHVAICPVLDPIHPSSQPRVTGRKRRVDARTRRCAYWRFFCMVAEEHVSGTGGRHPVPVTLSFLSRARRAATGLGRKGLIMNKDIAVPCQDRKHNNSPVLIVRRRCACSNL